MEKQLVETLNNRDSRKLSRDEQRRRSKRLEEILKIRKKLVNMKSQLMNEAEAAINNVPDTLTFPDLGDQASAEIDRNFTLRLRERERKLLKKIDKSLEDIEGGKYGFCETCGQEIGIKRLEARPVTSLCIDCKVEQEEEEKMRED
ncbi:MAG: RNA polymerase-binding protein DksA [Nitrospirae bacterium]|nr:RNA polymerase-binding protein DksA [Nitrospirota bacterium]